MLPSSSSFLLFLAGALVLLAVDDDFLEFGFAVVADVFVNGHSRLRFLDDQYSKRTTGQAECEVR